MVKTEQAIETALKMSQARRDVRKCYPEALAQMCEVVHPILEKLKPANPIHWAFAEMETTGKDWSHNTQLVFHVAVLEWAYPAELDEESLLEKLLKLCNESNGK